MKQTNHRLKLMVTVLVLLLAQPLQALTITPQAFDELWADISTRDRAELDTMEVSPRAAEDREYVALDPSDAVVFSGSPEEYTLDLPAVTTPWHVFIDDVHVVAPDPAKTRIILKDTATAEGSIRVEVPADFLEHGGGITVDPFSTPPQIKINAGTTKMVDGTFILDITAPIEAIKGRCSLPLTLSNFKRGNLDVKLVGNSDLELLDSTVTSLCLDGQGSGHYELSGNYDYLSMDLAGSIAVDGAGLKTNKLHARLDSVLRADLGNGGQSILEVIGATEITPPTGDVVRLGD